MFDSRSLRKISTNELNWLKRNYKISECEDGKEGITRKDFGKNMPGKDVNKHNKSNFGNKIAMYIKKKIRYLLKCWLQCVL